MSGEKWVVYHPEDGIIACCPSQSEAVEILRQLRRRLTIACCPSQSEAVEILRQLRRRLTEFAHDDGEWGDYCEGAFVARVTHELELEILSTTTSPAGEALYDLVIRRINSPGQGGDE